MRCSAGFAKLRAAAPETGVSYKAERPICCPRQERGLTSIRAGLCRRYGGQPTQIIVPVSQTISLQMAETGGSPHQRPAPWVTLAGGSQCGETVME